MLRTTLGLGFGTRPGFGRKLLGPRICERGPGCGIGQNPTQLEMTQAKEFQAQLTAYQAASWVCGERNVFDDVRYLRDCRQVSYAGSMHALFLLDKDLFCAVMANAVGHHHEKIEMMAKYPKDLRLQMLDRLIWDKTPHIEQPHFEKISSCAISILAFGYWADYVGQNKAEIQNTTDDLYKYTKKKAQLINQIILYLNDTGYLAGDRAKADKTQEELDILVQALLADLDPDVFSGLSQFSIGYLIRRYGQEFVDVLKQQHKNPGNWKADWGEKPTEEEMTRAADYYYQVLAQEGGSIENKLNNFMQNFNGSWRALFYFDQDFFVAVMAEKYGSHHQTTKELAKYPLALRLAMLECLIVETIPQDEDGRFYLSNTATHTTYALIAVGHYGPHVTGNLEHILEVDDSLFYLLKYTSKKAQLINQVVVYILDPLSTQSNRTMTENTAKKLDKLAQYLRDNPDPSIYPQLVQPVIDFLTQKYGADLVDLLRGQSRVGGSETRERSGVGGSEMRERSGVEGSELGEWKQEWGDKPSDAAIAQAKDFQAKGLRRAKAADEFFEQKIDLKALFYVAPDLLVEVMAFGDGYHFQMADILLDKTDAFMLALIDRMVLAESPDDPKEWSPAHPNMFSLINISQKARLKDELILEYLRTSPKRTQFIEQMIFAALRTTGQNAFFMEAFVYKFLGLYFFELEKSGETIRIEKEYALQYLEMKLKQYSAAWAKKQSQAVEWKPEWGNKPTDEEIAAARQFKEKRLLGHLASIAYFEQKINLKALFYVDPQLTVEVIANTRRGNHNELARQMRLLARPFLIAVVDRLVLDESPATLEEAGGSARNMYALAKVVVNFTGMVDVLVDYFKQTDKQRQFVEQFVSAVLLKLEVEAANIDGIVNHVLRRCFYTNKDAVLEIEQTYAWEYLAAQFGQLLNGKVVKKQTATAVEWKEEWGPKPTDGEIAAAKAFLAKGYQEEAAAAEFLQDEEVNVRALFYVDPDRAAAVVGMAQGNHTEISLQRLLKETREFVLELLDHIILSESPTSLTGEKNIAVIRHMEAYMEYNTYAFVHGARSYIKNFIDLLQLTNKKAHFINQLIYTISRGDRASFRARLLEYFHKLMLHLEKTGEKIEIWGELADYSKQWLSQYNPSLAKIFGMPAPSAQKWKPEWGDAPSQPEIEKARQFMKTWNAAHEDAAAALIKAKISVSTLYFLNPEYAINIVGHAEGNHQNVGRLVASESEAFTFEFFDALIEGKPIFMESFASVIIAMGDRLKKTAGETLAKYLLQTKKKKQLLQQIHYACTSSTAQGGKLRQSIGPWIFELAQLLGPILVWQELEEPTQQFYTKLARHEGVPELLDLLGKAAAEKKEIDPELFLVDLVRTEREQYLGTNYSPKGVELFLKTFQENERSSALEAILKQDENSGRMLMRSAKGHHVEIAAALAKVPQEVLLPALQKEILEFPVLDPNNRQALSDFYTHNGFGAMKYLIYNGDPTQIKMSLLFSRLSNQAIAKLLQIFHVFCTMESMLGRMLASPLRTALNNLGLARTAEISSATSNETADWLKNSGVIDFGEMLAMAGGVNLGPNEIGFHGKVYSPAAWEEFKKSGKRLKELDPRQRGIVLRSAKFHTETRNLLESFSNQEIAQILDSELSNFANFENDYETRQFMELDGCSLMKIVALLAIERSVAIFNLISPAAAATIFEQARYFSQTSEYFFNEFVSRLKSADLDRNRIVRVLPLLKEQTNAWIKLKVFNREMDELEFEDRMRKTLENDPDFLQIAKTNDLDEARRLAMRFIGQLHKKHASDLPSMADDLYIVTYEYLNARRLLDIRGKKEIADSRELFLLAELAKRIIEIRAPQILASGVDLRGIKDGAVVAKVAIIDSADWKQNMPALYHLSPFNLVVIDEHPANDATMSKVAAMVTSRNKGDHDHATLRAKDWGIPLASLPAASKFLKALNGKWVVFEVKGKVATIKLASTEQVKAAQAQYGLIPVEEAVKDKADILNSPAQVRENVGRVGTKAFNLAELAGYTNVPPFYVVTSGASHRYFRMIGLYKSAREILGAYQTNEPQVLASKLAKIRELVMQGVLPQHYLQGVNAQNIIARASTNFEDLQDFTAAGVYGSYVGIGEDLEMIIKKAMASYWGDTAFAYREKYGVDHFEQLPAVIVQAFIPGDFSGNMIVSSDQAIVNIVPGLGEGHASGRVAADEYHYSFGKGVFTETIKRPRGEAARISGYEPLIEQEQLADDLVIKLALIGQMIFAKKGSRQDVEWTIKDGEIFIVQTRPV